MSKNICVYCASSNSISNGFFEAAAQLGELIARRGYTLVYGGGNVGLMGAVASSVHEHGGRIVGVIPKFLQDRELAYQNADELIVTKDMRERKAIMESRADAFIGLPGGFGTLEELLEIITLKQLRVHQKPIVFLNVSGFYNGLNEVFEHMYKHNFVNESCRSIYHFTNDPAEALDYIDNYEPPILEAKWF